MAVAVEVVGAGVGSSGVRITGESSTGGGHAVVAGHDSSSANGSGGSSRDSRAASDPKSGVLGDWCDLFGRSSLAALLRLRHFNCLFGSWSRLLGICSMAAWSRWM